METIRGVMDKLLKETIKKRLKELEKQAKEIESIIVSYEDNMFVNLVKQHIRRVLREIGTATSFLSLMED
jgi:hypothetical protein